MYRHNVCLYAIARNEESFVDRFMDSAREADRVVVLDLGSEDATVMRLEARGAEVYRQLVLPFRFDEARNRALDLVPPECDLCASADLDEAFDPGWREALEAGWPPHAARASCAFFPGGGDFSYPAERFHLRAGARWTHPVHETLAFPGAEAGAPAHIGAISLRAQGERAVPDYDYLTLLRWNLEENPDEARAAFLLGRALCHAGKYEEGIPMLIRHLAMPCATWDEERSASAALVAESLAAQGHAAAARTWFYRAIGECPRAREPYYRAALFGYLREDWPLVFFMADRALRIPDPTGSSLSEPDAYGGMLNEIGAIAANHMGLPGISPAYASRASEYAPGDAQFFQNGARIAGGKEAAHGKV